MERPPHAARVFKRPFPGSLLQTVGRPAPRGRSPSADHSKAATQSAVAWARNSWKA